MSLKYLPEHARDALLTLDLARKEAEHLRYTLLAWYVDIAWAQAPCHQLEISEKVELLASVDAFFLARKLCTELVQEYTYLESLHATGLTCKMFFDASDNAKAEVIRFGIMQTIDENGQAAADKFANLPVLPFAKPLTLRLCPPNSSTSPNLTCQHCSSFLHAYSKYATSKTEQRFLAPTVRSIAA